MYPGAYSGQFPDKPAVITAETGEIVTYAELEANSIRIARRFRGMGLRTGSHVAVVARNTPRVFDLYWAALRSGIYLTMVNWHLTPVEVAYIANDCGAEALIVDAGLEELSGALPELTPDCRHYLSFGGAVAGYDNLDVDMLAESSVPLDDQPRGIDMLYSSGTTGQPKGIKPALPTGEIEDAGDKVVEMNDKVWGVGPETVGFSPAPLYHSAPLRFSGAVHALGGTVVLTDRFDAERSLEYIEKYKITHSHWVPTMFIRMLKLSVDVREKYDVSSLRVVVHAAAPCPVEIKRQIIDWFGPIVWEYYSSTEFNGMTVVSSAEWVDRPGTVGRAAVGVIHVCGDGGAELDPGTSGTVYFERDVLPFEYHNAPEKTRSAQHPDHPTWTTTGDLGYVDELGYLYLTDRDSFMIISGGVNIYPQEIENALVEHPKVFDAAVIGMPDPDMGEMVTAAITPIEGVAGDDDLRDELVTYLGTGIARFKIPRRIEFMSDLSRTPTGKLVKRNLKKQLIDADQAKLS
jgi:long-chain acyl-CoA synthetase